MDVEQEVKEFIDKIDVKFQELWETLSYFKGNKSDGLGERAIDFQSTLANCQFSIDKKFRQIRAKQKEVRNSRKDYSKSEYVLLDKKLTNCQSALTHLIYLGKSLGDAFAWFFFQNDRDLLDEHLLHQDEFLMPSGELGRMGEMGFIQNIRIIEDNLVIYHGITNILRVGDFSLVNLKTHRFTGISELKTDRMNGDEVSVRFITFGPKDKVNPLFSKFSKEPEERPDIEGSVKDERDQRLDKQIKTMVSTLENADIKPSKTDTIYSKSYLDELKKLLEKDHPIVSCLKASDGMLFVVVRNQETRLSKRLFETSPFMDADKTGLEEQFLSIMDKSTDKNKLLFGTIHYAQEKGINTCQGTKPLFWSELPIEYVKKIYFGEIEVLTIYNPLHLWRILEKKGFKSEYIESLNEHCLVMKRDSGTIEMAFPRTSMGYFFNLITCHLTDERTILKMIGETIESVKDINEPAKVVTRFRMV